MITNARIEKKKSDITKTETRLAEVKAKLRNQKQDLIDLENEEIVAMFRKEVITEDDLKALMRSRQEIENDVEDDSPDERTLNAQEKKEESNNALQDN
jgi:hypothetical protein